MYPQMGHKKRNQTINHNEIDFRYGKDSMDRFGDDLCRLLLSYHSFEEHFRHECVSKQFQRSLYDTVDNIAINDELMDKMTKSVCTPTGAAWGQRLPLIMEKCPNIQRIDCREMALNERLFSLQIIRGNCRRLREIYCDFTDFEGSLDVFQWFGSLFKRLNVDDLDADPQLYLTLCPHLSHLKLYYFNEVFSDDSHQRLLVKNLRKFEFYMDLDYNNDMFDTFIAGNQSLKSLVMSGISPEIKSLDEICKFMNALKKLPELRELVLNFADIWTGSVTPIGKTIVAIGSTLKRLKRFDLTVHVKVCPRYSMFDYLPDYPQLRRLSVRVDGCLRVDTILDIYVALRRCKRLTHIRLKLSQFNPRFFGGIHEYLPRLQRLDIWDPKGELNGFCLDDASRLPALQNLTIHTKQALILKLMDSCHHSYMDVVYRSVCDKKTLVIHPPYKRPDLDVLSGRQKYLYRIVDKFRKLIQIELTRLD